jgi:uncharacterized protein (DUF2147 family)
MFFLSKILLCFSLCFVVTTASQSIDAGADRILGRWLFPKKQTCVEIYRENGLYFGRMAEVSASAAANYGNIRNKIVLTNLAYNNNQWEGGSMIHPSSGARFSVEMRLHDPNTLIATVYKGVRFISKDLVLTRQR